ncbi:MAG: 2-oxo-tetronate isomerase [Labrys sp. (in: a-proteobacteria)]
MPRFAANLSMLFTEWPFLDRFAAAAGAGFDAVEFLFPYDHAPEEIAARLQRNNLTLVNFNLPPGDWAAGERGLAALPERRAAFRSSVDTALAYARATGVRRLHMMAGLADPGVRANAECYLDNLRYAAGRLADWDIDLLIEPLNGRDMPGYFLNDFNQARGFIVEAGRANAKLQFDIYHRQILHGDVTQALTALMPIIGHIQIASVPGRHEPDSEELSFVHLCTTIDSLGYAGHIGCEYRPRAGTLAGLGWFTSFAEAA